MWECVRERDDKQSIWYVSVDKKKKKKKNIVWN
jgi:hypothetical protein